MSFINKKRSRVSTRAAPIAIYVSSDEEFVPEGYTSLSKNEEIRRCVYKIADLVSNMTIMLMENGEKGDIRLKNELSKKIDVYPNKNMTRKLFIHKIVTDMCIYGNCVCVPRLTDDIDFNNRDRNYIDNLEMLDSRNLSFAKVGNGYEIRCRNIVYNPDEVLHFSLNPSDDNPFKGDGFTNLIKNVVSTLLQANATKKGFLKSKWKPSMIISIQSDVEELTNKELRTKILESYTQTTEAGEPWLIPAGEIDVKTVQPLTLNDLAIQDSITLDLKTIAAAIGVPPFMVGVGDFNKDQYNNFIATEIMSFAMIIQQELTRKVLYSPKMYFKFNPKSLMQYSLTEQVSFVKEMVGGGMLNRNEGRSEFDYSPVDVDGMNDYTVLENYLQVADLSKQKKLIQEGGEPDD